MLPVVEFGPKNIPQFGSRRTRRPKAQRFDPRADLRIVRDSDHLLLEVFDDIAFGPYRRIDRIPAGCDDIGAAFYKRRYGRQVGRSLRTACGEDAELAGIVLFNEFRACRKVRRNPCREKIGKSGCRSTIGNVLEVQLEGAGKLGRLDMRTRTGPGRTIHRLLGVRFVPGNKVLD